jgi:superoxide dismutase, Fe-Mn family
MSRSIRKEQHVSITRRGLVVGTAAFAAAAFLPRTVLAQEVAGPFKLDPLPYPANALVPHIDARTMEIHHDFHHRAYVNGLNTAVKDHADVAAMPLQDILGRLTEMPEAIRTALRNFGGGHANHAMFWQVMGSQAMGRQVKGSQVKRAQEKGAQEKGAHGTAPTGDLAAAINRDLGGLRKLQDAFNLAGMRLFGYGWVFVTVTKDGKLSIETRPNQDTPLMDGKRVLFGNDLWEHAYYLTYKQRRRDYLEAWWNVVNWPKVGQRYAGAKADKLTI